MGCSYLFSMACVFPSVPEGLAGSHGSSVQRLEDHQFAVPPPVHRVPFFHTLTSTCCLRFLILGLLAAVTEAVSRGLAGRRTDRFSSVSHELDVSLEHPHGEVQQAAEYTHPEPKREARARDTDFGTGANGVRGCRGAPLERILNVSREEG